MREVKHIAGAAVLCVGPTGLPSTGQAVATESWLVNSSHRIGAVNNNFEGFGLASRLGHTILLPLRVFLKSYRTKPTAMYLSIKRSAFGATADLACLWIFKCVSRGPVVVHLHGADLKNSRKSRIIDALFHLIWLAVTDVIILSPRMAEQLDGLPYKRVHVVPNFAAQMCSEHSVSRKVDSAEIGPLRVLFLSNIMFTKGFLHLIEAVKSVRSEGIDIRLALAGKALDDDMMSASDAFAALNSSLEEGIEYLGVLTGREKWHQLEKAHVVALPTSYPVEAQPISLIEGMAFGAVPLTTRHNYNEDFLDPRVAVFVAHQSSVDIADALRMLFKNRAALARRIRLAWDIAHERHQTSSYVQRIDRILAHAIDIGA